jgi:hypothetical protein
MRISYCFELKLDRAPEGNDGLLGGRADARTVFLVLLVIVLDIYMNLN